MGIEGACRLVLGIETLILQSSGVEMSIKGVDENAFVPGQRYCKGRSTGKAGQKDALICS